MIFNPMFFSESGNTAAMVTKPNKLSNNKYLFSDIVKVVMSPEREQKKILEKNIDSVINPELRIVPGVEQNPEQLKLEFLNDSETEKVKLELADILPTDIAKLLIDDETEIDKNKAVSYLSKEPLNSDLQIFLNGLVGEKLIKNTVSKNTGVFLSLEDGKSAVNIELTQELSNPKAEGKIIVQTLVVPEKSKLISLINNTNENSRLIQNKFNNKVLEADTQITVKSNNESNTSVMKPTLSVYSFKNNDGNYDLTKGMKEISGKNNGINILKNINRAVNEKYVSSKNVPLEKISFVPRNYIDKNINVKTDETKNLKYIKPGTQIKVSSKNYNVSKITILKKQESSNELLTKNTNSKNISTSLRKINFAHNVNNKTELNLLNKEITDGRKVKYSNPSNKSSEKAAGIKNTGQSANLSKLSSNTSPDTISDIETKKLKIVNNNSDNNLTESKKTDKNVLKEGSTSKAGKLELHNNDARTAETKGNSKAADENVMQKGSDKLPSKESTAKLSQSENAQNILKDTIIDGKENFKRSEVDKKINNQKEILTKDNSIKSEGTLTSNKISYKSKANNKELVNNKSDKSQVKESGQTSNKIESYSLQGKVENNNIEGKESLDIKQKVNGTTKTEDIEGESKTTKTFSGVEKKEGIKKNIVEPKESISRNKSEQSVKEEKSESNISNKDRAVIDEKKNEQNTKQINERDMKPIHNKVLDANKDAENSKGYQKEKIAGNEIPVNLIEDKPVKRNNKKISVKVKGGVKKVSENNNSGSEGTKVKSDSDSSQTNNNSSETNLNKNGTNEFNVNEHINIKHGNEHNFSNALHKEGFKSPDIQAVQTGNNTFPDNQRVIKSIEVIKEISRFIAQKEKGTFSFKIEPEHLGKMKITLDTIDNLLKATIEVDSEQSKQMIERNLNKLYNQLNENGVQLNSLNISLGNSKNNKAEEETQNNKSNKPEDNSQVGETKEKTKQKKSLGYNTYEFIA